MAAAIRSVASRTKAYLTMHSYGPSLLYPWSYTATLPDDAEALDTLATKAVAKLKEVNGTEYSVGSAGSTLCI